MPCCLEQPPLLSCRRTTSPCKESCLQSSLPLCQSALRSSMHSLPCYRAPLLGGPPEGRRTSRLHLAAVAVAAAALAVLLLWLLHPAHHVRMPHSPAEDALLDWEAGKKPIVHGDPPFCRKSASIAVLPGEDNNLQLLIWSGIGECGCACARLGSSRRPLPAGNWLCLGMQWRAALGVCNSVLFARGYRTPAARRHPQNLPLPMQLHLAGLHKSMFDDLHRLDMAQLRWTTENTTGSSKRPWGGRWKAGNAQVRQETPLWGRRAGECVLLHALHSRPGSATPPSHSTGTAASCLSGRSAAAQLPHLCAGSSRRACCCGR